MSVTHNPAVGCSCVASSSGLAARSALQPAQGQLDRSIWIDDGLGDAVTAGPVDSVYPVLLGDMPAPRLRAYPTYTVIAEKLHAIGLLGIANSRL